MAKKKAKTKWTESRVCELLEKKYPTGAFAVLRQVRNGTGFSRGTTRTADAIAASLWPSRGNHLIGFEIKVSRSDWLKEIADPSKAYEFQRFCKYWYVVAPEGIVDLSEVPDTWGLIECGRSARDKKPAPAQAFEPPDVLLLCAIMRKLSETTLPKSEVARRVKEATVELEAAQEAQVTYYKKENELKRLKQDVTAFEEASGVSIQRYRGGELGRAVKFARESGVMGALASARRLRDTAAKLVEQLDDSIANLDTQEPAEV